MGSLNPDAEAKQELDDSGYVQDETKQAAEETKPAEEYTGTAELLDLSDDVLLYILQNLSPQDLKALGFTCARLGALVLDRTLWVDVDAGGAALGRRRVRWLLSRALGPHTRRLRLRGYADQAQGCLGYVNQCNYSGNDDDTAASGSTPPEEERYLCGGPRVYRLTQTLPKYGGTGGQPLSPAPDGCCGPRLTLTHTALRELGATCNTLRTLELEHCVIDCQTTNIGMFPKTLTKLSLKGTKCFNLESKSFLFKIQDHLSHLEELDVSYCSWIEPACMLPLSKMPCLHTLSMRECLKLAEFVAYASLATRYGFKKLKKLDLSGSPVGDSEVSALGWLPRLRELRLAPARRSPRTSEHAHYSQDLLPEHNELDEWEEVEPEYFRPPPISEDEWMRDEDDVNGNQSRYYATNCEDPSACILLERMIAEPVAPEEYSQVYHQFLAGHNNNVPLANPEEYRQAYRQFMFRPTHGHPPAGYSLFIRKPEDMNEAGPSKRRRTEPTRSNEAKPGTSTEDNPIPSTSSDQPSSSSASQPTGSAAQPTGNATDQPTDRSTRKRDSDDADRGPPSKRNNNSPKNTKKKRSRGRSDNGHRQPRRVFEITINELSARLRAPNHVVNVARNVAIIANIVEKVRNNEDNVADDGENVDNNVANVASNVAIVASNAANIASNVTKEASNVAIVASNVANAGNNEADVSDNSANVASIVANVTNNEVNAISNETNVANDNDANEVNTEANNKSNCDNKNKNNNKSIDCKTVDNSDVANASGSDQAANSAGNVSANDQSTGNATANVTCNPIEANANAMAGPSLPNLVSTANTIRASTELDLNITKTSNTVGNGPAVANIAGNEIPAANDSGNDASVNAAGNNAADANAAGNVPVVGIPAGNAVANAIAIGTAPVVDMTPGDASGNATVDANAAGNIPVVAIPAGNAVAYANAAGNGPVVNIAPGDASGNATADANASGNVPVVAIPAGNDPVVDIAPDNAFGNAAADADAAGNDADIANDAGNGPIIAIVAGGANGNMPVEANAGDEIDGAAIAADYVPARQRIFQFRQYRRPIVIEEFINVGDPEAQGVLPRGVMFPGCPTRLDPTALVSDASIRRFGRAIGENINYIHIGGGAGDGNARPDRSSLTFLSVTGFRHVTDASLLHLATAAPLLQQLDVSGTAVTAAAVERFKAMRPDVEVTADHLDKP